MLLTVKKAAELLCLGTSKVNQLIASGELRSVKIGKSRRVDISDVEAFINSKRVEL